MNQLFLRVGSWIMRVVALFTSKEGLFCLIKKQKEGSFSHFPQS
jgi:hypothetical protein